MPEPATAVPGVATALAPAIDGFAGMAFPLPFRRYQELALEAFDRSRAAGDRRHYLTLPPGAGKTLLGLEIARRLGRPTLVLAPNTAIVGQWLDQWSRFEPPLVPALDDDDLLAPLTVLTYQALCVLDREVPEADDDDADDGDGADGPAAAPGEVATPQAEPSIELTPAQRRRLIARGGDREAVLGLLHRNGRAIVDRLAALGPVTLVLDESHHLLEIWGSLLAAVIESVHPDSSVVALTATPPLDLGPREQALHDALFGTRADVEVVAPAVVKDGWLAPYQELALLVEPLADEARFIDAQAARFSGLLADVQGPDLASLPFTAWLERRVVMRRSPDGAQVAWATLEAEDPDLARAALRLRWQRGEPPPPGARSTEAHRRAPDAADWAALLDRWAMESLATSDDPRDRAAWERLREALPAAGYRLTVRGVVRGPSVVDRVLALSGGKALAAASILAVEADALGDRLRALVLCDHESAGRDPGVRLRGVLDPAAGSATLVLRTLLDGTAPPGLEPVLVTGRSVACGRGTAERLVRFAAAIAAGAQDAPGTGRPPRPRSAAARLLDGAQALVGWDPLAASAPSLPVHGPRAGGSTADHAAWDDLVLIDPPDPRWSSRTWVPLITRFFAEGGTHCLIGTRALLGEGWDAPAVNVVVDLTAATTRAAVHQMRGRGMRLDPADPGKVADLWDVACVADGHPQGAADHARLARKHLHDLSVNAQGEVETGVSHVDPGLSPYAPMAAAERADLRARMLARPAQRVAARAAWRIGEPYRDVPVATVRVRTRRSPGVPLRDPLRHHPAVRGDGATRIRRTIVVAALLAVVLGLVAAWLEGPVGGLVGLGIGLLVGVGWVLLLLVGGLRTIEPSDILLDLGRAVADALAASGLIDRSAGWEAVRVLPQPDGWYRCLLAGASASDAERFAGALDELVAPLWDPRWLVPRPVLEVQPTLTGAARYVRQRLSGRYASAPRVWHAVPDVLAGRHEHVVAFQAAWSRWVAPGAVAVRARDPLGEAILAARRGDDPFETETQLRTLWT